jgi:hypothetical protein
MASPATWRRVVLAFCASEGLRGADLQRLHQRLGLGLDDALTTRVAQLPGTIMLLAAALGAFGGLMWLAAQWGEMSRALRFVLLQAVVLATALAAWRWPRARAPLALLSFFASGGLFAFFGTTYQTGADPWQLFALWAALTLPLALALRSDVLWAFWVLVAMVAVSLWTHANSDHVGWSQGARLWPLLAQQLMAGLVILAMAPAWEGFTGVGLWGWRSSLVLWLVMVVWTSIDLMLVSDSWPSHTLPVGVIVGVAWWASRPDSSDVFALSVVMLAANLLLAIVFLTWIFPKNESLTIAVMAMALTMAAAVAGAARWVWAVAQRQSNSGARA